MKWIPVSERLPEDSGDYLVCPSDSVLEDYSDFSEVMIMPYDADCEAFGWWTERYDPISLGFVDCDFNEFEVLAWMPLPQPYTADRKTEPQTEYEKVKEAEHRMANIIANMDELKDEPQTKETEMERLERIDNDIEDAWARIRELTDEPQTDCGWR